MPENPAPSVLTTALGLASIGTGTLFVAALALYLGPEDWHEAAWRVLRASGAIGLTFLGAVHWGLGITDVCDDDRSRISAFCWSLVPAFLAWLVLVLELAGGPTALLLAVGFSAQFVADRSAERAGFCPSWYLTIRSRQTVAVLVCLLAVLLIGEHY